VLHSLRHTFGTRLGEAGADAFPIMRLMGHSSITVSQRYVHPTPATLENAVLALEKQQLTVAAEIESEAALTTDITKSNENAAF
jgi:integrase